MKKSQSHPQRDQMSNSIKNIIAVTASVYSVAVIVIYYYLALNYKIKLNYFYFSSFFISISLFSGLIFSILDNKFISAIVLGCCCFFTGTSIAYIIDWIGSGIPKMNHVYECLMFGVSISLLIILYQYGQRIIICKLSRMDN